MGENVSRRDFLKTTSISAAGVTALSFKPLSAALGPVQDKSRIIIAKDEDCFNLSSGTVDEDKIQEMVDYAIIWLMKAPSKAEAYEALFPTGKLTTDTKILIKYNNAKSVSKTRNHVMDALENGLTSMLGGTFPKANIERMGSKDDCGSGVSSETFNVGSSNKYEIRQKFVDCDYFINMPSCWAISSVGCGVTLSLKALMAAVSGSLGNMHNQNFISETTPALSLMNEHPVFKEKQILALADAICLGAGGNQQNIDSAAYCVIASKDMVAVDYLAIDKMDQTGKLSSSNKTAALKVCERAADPDYGLGTDDPTNMEKEEIEPPWTNPWLTGVKSTGDKNISSSDVHVNTNPTHTVFSYHNTAGSQATVSIYDMQGRKIWEHMSSESGIVWNNSDIKGRKVSRGTYLYQLKVGKVTAEGRIAVK